jgi:F420-dependent oxidoreductase-like protein
MSTLEAAHPVRIGAAFWIQRTDWPSLRDAVVAAERSGVDSLWVDDHLLCDEGDPNDSKLEGWATLAALAAATSRAQIGLLVAANTFRNPGLTAKLATTVDHVSDGRSVLGLGGGWFDREHEAFGVDFGSGHGERLDRLEESVGLIRRLLDGERVTHEGRFYRFNDALCEPRPVQDPLPILIGGSGPRKTLRTVARHADLWNAYGTPETLAASDAILVEHCAAVGRDPASIERTFTMNVVVRESRAAATAVWQSYLATHDPGAWESRFAAGPPAEIAAALADYAAVGFRHPILVFRTPWDLETIAALGEIRDELARLAA